MPVATRVALCASTVRTHVACVDTRGVIMRCVVKFRRVEMRPSKESACGRPTGTGEQPNPPWPRVARRLNGWVAVCNSSAGVCRSRAVHSGHSATEVKCGSAQRTSKFDAGRPSRMSDAGRSGLLTRRPATGAMPCTHRDTDARLAATGACVLASYAISSAHTFTPGRKLRSCSFSVMSALRPRATGSELPSIASDM